MNKMSPMFVLLYRHNSVYFSSNIVLIVTAVGQSHAAAVNGNGEVYLWGNNKDTQVCPKKIALVPKPMKVTGLNTVSIKQVGFIENKFIYDFILRIFISLKTQIQSNDHYLTIYDNYWIICPVVLIFVTWWFKAI